MSTKIYNGFKIDSNDIFEVQNILMGHHEKVKEITENKTIEFLIRFAVEGLDKDTIEGKETKKNYLSEAGSSLMDRQREVKKSGYRDPVIDFEAEVVVIPYEGKFYGIYYSQQDAFLNNLLENPKVSEFGYWDNTERDDKVSAKEWKQRQKIWDGIFKDTSIPGEIGFSKKFNAYVPYPEIESIAEKWEQFCPTFEKRLKYWTAETHIEREMGRKKDILKEDCSNAISLYLNIKRDDSDDAQKRKEEVRKEVESKLLKDISPQSIGINVEKAKKPKIR